MNMDRSSSDFQLFVSNLYEANDFEQAFNVFESQVLKLGFDGVLYTYIPRVLLDTQFHLNPVYHVSSEYSPKYMEHYTEARFERVDPLVQAVQDGIVNPISWINTAKDYGINNGVTLPLLSGQSGIAGASIISEETKAFSKLLDSRIEILTLCTRLFHNMVLSNAPYKAEFSKPMLNSLSKTELQLLTGLSRGQSPAQIASEINRSEGYLEQVMIKMRRKLSGVESEDIPIINKNQLLYYAGLLNILDDFSQ